MIELKATAIKQEKLLYAVLGTNKIEVSNIIQNKSNYYYSYGKIETDKKNNVIYRNGKPKVRTINASKGRLKSLQKLINERILKNIPLPSVVNGGVRGRSNVTNARVHLGKRYKFKTDIKNFFPSISCQRVFEMFLSNGFSSKVASILTHLATDKFQLPQGAPTSPSIANLVFVPVDNKLIEFSNLHGLTYTRFVDDLVFSSQVDFTNHISKLIGIIINSGFRVSQRKSVNKTGKMVITGILTKQNVLDVPDDLKELIVDDTIAPQTTAARIRYIEHVKSYLKKENLRKGEERKQRPSENQKNVFGLTFTYKKSKYSFTVEFIHLGYNYHFCVFVNGKLFYFEPDENRKLRARVDLKDLNGAHKINKDLLRTIAQKIRATFDKVTVVSN